MTEQLPNKGREVMKVAIAMAVVSMLSTIWRLAVRFRISPWMGGSDWLMLAGTTMSFVCNIPFVLRGVQAGTGRLVADPFWTSDRILTFAHLQFTAICLQMYAIFLVKLSVCTYLLALNFSKSFKVIMYVITLIVVTFDLVMPLLLHFAYCRPFYFRWHPEIVPQCWPEMVGTVTEYAQIVSNISTDLAYASAPIVYLRQANLTKQMRFVVKLIFLLALAGTASSIVKMIKMHRWLHSSEPFHDIADLCIWGINEISICIIVANLPIQRRSIWKAITLIIPQHLHSRFGVQSDARYSLDDVYPSMSENSRQTRSTTPDSDNRSEMTIVELENGRIAMAPKKMLPAVVREDSNEGTLATFWKNDSKDSFS